jgi:hypothetical protein
MATNPRYWTTVLWAGLAAGVGDTLLALLLFQVSPVRIYQSVAAGLLGRDSFQGGLATAALGMFLHFFIATTAAAVYVAASTRLRLLLTQPVACGLAFGVAVYFFMNLIVVPLSRAARAGGFSFSWRLMVGHALLVGLPIALVARRRLGQGAVN